MSLDPAFGTFDLTKSNGIAIAQFDDTIIRKTVFEDRLKRDGSQFIREKLSGRIVRITGNVAGSSDSDTRGKLDDLLNAVFEGEDYLYLWSTRKLLCRVSEDSNFQWRPAATGAIVDFRIVFRSREPYWLYYQENTDNLSFSGASPDQETTSNVSSEAPTWFHSFTITNNGSAFTDKYMVLNNVTNGGQLTIEGISMDAGQSIVIDFVEGEITLGSSTIGVFKSQSGEFWELSGGGVANEIEIEHNIGAGMSLGVVAKWYDRYFGA